MNDLNFCSFAASIPGTVEDYHNETRFFEGLDPTRELPPWTRWSDTLHFSAVRRLTVHVRGRLVGGDEDCSDVNNHCEEVYVYADEWWPRGRYLATVKGHSQGTTLSGRVMGHGRVVDIDIGNASDQSQLPTGPVYLNLTPGDNRPISYRVIYGHRPVFLNDPSYYHCQFALPLWLGFLWDRGYRWAKKVAGWVKDL